MMPRHINPPIKDKERTATAPYNFVPLPNRVYTVSDDRGSGDPKKTPWKAHDQFVTGTHSGWIDLTLKTLTPLFIRGPVIRQNGEWDKRDSRLRPEPFTAPNGTPMIPGSSLRGMIRTLVEILSFSKIQPVTGEKPFFRTVADNRIGRTYRTRMIRDNRKPPGGYLKKEGDQWTIIPAIEVLRAHRDLLNKLALNIPDKPKPNYCPNWNGQHKPCWFKRDSHRKSNVAEICLDLKKDGWEEGTLVLTGSAPNKKFDFVFCGRGIDHPIMIPEEKWLRFHDEDQITQWQEKAFPANQPPAAHRKKKGHSRDGEPVFFLCDESKKSGENPDGLLFFGRAQMFRFPYDRSPLDLIPEEMRNGLDLAEVIFGKVEQKKNNEQQAIKGRVFFEDAVATGGGSEWFENIIVPRILSSPKVTCFPHYLTQDGTKDSKKLTTYLEGDQTTIRGHKLYWHRWDEAQKLKMVKEPKEHDALLRDLQSEKPNDSQHTRIRPVRAGRTFTGRVRFENLTGIELGALLSAFKLPEDCAHKLGMGKPIGLGSVRIEPALHLIDRAKRYVCWEDRGVSQSKGNDFLDAFEKAISEHAESAGETTIANQSGLRRFARIDVMFQLLKWDGRLNPSSTECMILDKFRSKPVLPTPRQVAKQFEPPWPDDPPRLVKEKTESSSLSASHGFVAPIPPPRPSISAKLVQKGQTREGRLKRMKDQWIVKFEGDEREAIIENPQRIPNEAQDGMKAEFLIIDQSKKRGIKARLMKML